MLISCQYFSKYTHRASQNARMYGFIQIIASKTMKCLHCDSDNHKFRVSSGKVRSIWIKTEQRLTIGLQNKISCTQFCYFTSECNMNTKLRVSLLYDMIWNNNNWHFMCYHSPHYLSHENTTIMTDYLTIES